jgi:hypothetical protein
MSANFAISFQCCQNVLIKLNESHDTVFFPVFACHTSGWQQNFYKMWVERREYILHLTFRIWHLYVFTKIIFLSDIEYHKILYDLYSNMKKIHSVDL